MELIGWIGAGMLAMCALPQCIECIRTGSTKGLNPWFLFLWAGGELLLYIYSVQAGAPMVIRLNYVVNLMLLTPIIGIKMYEHSRALPSGDDTEEGAEGDSP